MCPGRLVCNVNETRHSYLDSFTNGINYIGGTGSKSNPKAIGARACGRRAGAPSKKANSSVANLSSGNPRHPLSDLPGIARLRRHESRPRLFRGVCRAAHRRATVSRVTDSRSPSGGGTRFRLQPVPRCITSWSAGMSRGLSPTWAVSRAASPVTRSCAGSVPRRASCTWRSARWSTLRGTWPPSAPESRSGASLRT